MHPKALLASCTELLVQVLPMRRPADSVVSLFFKNNRGFGPRERATLAETTYAVLRKKPLFEHLALSCAGQRERKLAILGFHGDVDFLKSALSDSEKAWLDSCLPYLKDGQIPADTPDEFVHNLPAWLEKKLKEQLSAADFQALAKSLLSPAGLDLRVNSLKAKREQVQKALQNAGVKSEATAFSPLGIRLSGKPAIQKLELFTSGQIEVQDEGSQLLALMLQAGRGEMVADFCAGAGGKTLAIGAGMKNTGRLYAFDTSAHRLAALKPRLARSDLSNVHPAAIAHENDERIKRLSGKLDRVLVDAPCSGLGTIRRNPDLKWRQNLNAINELNIKQKSILKSAARLLKSGGRLIYATCSILKEENELIAKDFEENNKDFISLNAIDILAALKIENAKNLCSEDGKYLKLYPHLHNTDGFFAAIWQRK